MGCVSRHFCWRVGVPPSLCYPLYGFRCCTWGVCHVPSVGVCVSPVLCVTSCMGFRCCTWGVCRIPSVGVCVSPVHCVSLSVALVGTRGVFRVTIVGVWVSPVYCFFKYMVSISTWGGHLFSHITQVNLLSPYHSFIITTTF